MEASDVVLWNKLGSLAAAQGWWAAAKHAFERGLEADPQARSLHRAVPLHFDLLHCSWPALHLPALWP